MRILWIKTDLLHPVDKGGKIRSYQMLRSLARRHHVTYLCLNDGSAAPDAVELSKEYAQETVVVPFAPPRKGGLRFLLALVANLGSKLPYAVARYRSAELRRQIKRMAADADLVVCDFLMPAVNVDEELKDRMVLFQHNVEAMIWKRHATVPQNAIRRLYMKLQWRRMQRFEAVQCQRFRHVVAVSEGDARLMQAEYRASSVSFVPTGVDLGYFAATPGLRRSTDELVFVGSMDWMPNDEGVRWFIAEVFDLIRRQFPSAKLVVVGRLPSDTLRALASNSPCISVTGTVPDVRPYLERAAISIVPLRIGGGTRLKIYEAMALGAPVVSTTIGAEGLPLRDGEHLRLADTAAEQAAAIVELLRDPKRATSMAAVARSYVEANCSWHAVAEQFMANCAPLAPCPAS